MRGEDLAGKTLLAWSWLVVCIRFPPGTDMYGAAIAIGGMKDCDGDWGVGSRVRRCADDIYVGAAVDAVSGWGT